MTNGPAADWICPNGHAWDLLPGVEGVRAVPSEIDCPICGGADLNEVTSACLVKLQEDPAVTTMDIFAALSDEDRAKFERGCRVSAVKFGIRPHGFDAGREVCS